MTEPTRESTVFRRWRRASLVEGGDGSAGGWEGPRAKVKAANMPAARVSVRGRIEAERWGMGPPWVAILYEEQRMEDSLRY
jgi:hypothetical protein